MPSLSRRGFFGLLGGAAAAIALDPEKALWVPGKKLISIPRAYGGGPLQEFVVTELSVSMDEFTEMYLRPAAQQIVRTMERELRDYYRSVGIAGPMLQVGDRFTIAGVYS